MTGSILIYAPVPVHRDDRGLWIEEQAVDGLRLWAANFPAVTAMMLEDPGPVPRGWVPAAEAGDALRGVRIELLPTAWRPDRFLRAWRPTARRIGGLIDGATYLSFAIGGLFGDWGAVAAFEARRRGRPFAVWMDRIESTVVRNVARSPGPARTRLRARLTHRPMAALERAVVRRAALGLFQGQEVFDLMAPHARGPAEVVYDVHVGEEERIAPAALEAKVAGAAEGPLRLLYVGRADPMKGTADWIAVLEALAARGVDFRARWLGDGPDRAMLLDRIAAAGLAGRVEAPGWLEDRPAVLAAMREAHAYLFCHKTAESARCLIEALIAGTPLLGYGSAFPRGLVARHGGGMLVAPDDVGGLAAAAAGLAADRGRLAGLIRAAAADGAPFTDEAVFRHRSEVIRRHLPGPHAAATGGSG